MLFHEIYSLYYRAISKILVTANKRSISLSMLQKISHDLAFSESSLFIPEKLVDGNWPLLDCARMSILNHNPPGYISSLEKQWLKNVYTDKKSKLFRLQAYDIEDVDPLYNEETFVFFDQYSDGDLYDNKDYQLHFQMLMKAIKEDETVFVKYLATSETVLSCEGVPKTIEYSLKEDKFRCVIVCENGPKIVRISSIIECSISGNGVSPKDLQRDEGKKNIEVLVKDKRNALDRFLRQFADLEKETEQINEETYRVILKYHYNDEQEIIIRLLQFGPNVIVEKPVEIRKVIHSRIKKQMELFELV